MSSGREFDLIDWVRRRAGANFRVPVGIGDDTAVLLGGEKDWLATVDMLVEGVHFDLSLCRPEQVGRKAMAVNLSDIAAMAGEPVAAFVAIGVPTGRETSLAILVMQGILQLAEEHGVIVAGGDTNRSPAGLVVSVTLLGHPTGRGAVLRTGARPGDQLFVTGTLGYSLEGHHLDFTPRVREARILHERFDLRAMVDLSDGLGGDAFHLAQGCGIVIDQSSIPVARGSVENDPSVLDHALKDGEDFELLFALPAEQAEAIMDRPPFADPLITRIGEFIEGEGVYLRRIDGVIERMSPGGFAHEW